MCVDGYLSSQLEELYTTPKCWTSETRVVGDKLEPHTTTTWLCFTTFDLDTKAD